MIHLEKLTYENFEDVFELKPKKVQYPFVASNMFSVAEAYVTMINGGHVYPFVIYNDERVVGFIQLAYGENADQDGVSMEKDSYEVWRFMIDKRYQGRGYGSRRWISYAPSPRGRRSSAGYPTSRRTRPQGSSMPPSASRRPAKCAAMRSSRYLNYDH